MPLGFDIIAVSVLRAQDEDYTFYLDISAPASDMGMALTSLDGGGDDYMGPCINGNSTALQGPNAGGQLLGSLVGWVRLPGAGLAAHVTASPAPQRSARCLCG